MKAALITGAAHGIGRVIAAEFAKDHQTAITWHRKHPETSDRVLQIQADLTVPNAAQSVVDTIIQSYGRLDVIVNNAGAVLRSPVDAPVNEKDHQTMMELHVTAPAALLHAALPYLKPGACVINISSVNATLPPMGAAIYGATKAAQDIWMRGMARELGAKGIRLNAVAPGAVNTEENPRDPKLTQKFAELSAMGRLASAQDIANAVRFLASDDAQSITGQVLRVCAGYRL